MFVTKKNSQWEFGIKKVWKYAVKKVVAQSSHPVSKHQYEHPPNLKLECAQKVA
jgi:hypothetical protein